MPDGNHCSRPHPALVHDQMIKFERIARVNQGPDPGRIWDPDSDLYYGVLELEESKRVAGAGRPIMMHQVNADACLDYFFTREERLNQLVSSPTTRAELWDLYIARKSCNNGWHIPFLGVKADEKGRFDAKKELLRWINTTGPRVYLGGEITTFPDGFKNHNPAEGMRPGGWSPLNEADYYNAYELQKQEKVCLVHLHHIFFYISFFAAPAQGPHGQDSGDRSQPVRQGPDVDVAEGPHSAKASEEPSLHPQHLLQ